VLGVAALSGWPVAIDTVVGLIGGFGLVFIAVTSLMALPRHHRHHWQVETWEVEKGRPVVSLRSHHWHMVHNPRLDVAGANGRRWMAPPGHAYRDYAVQPGVSAGNVDLRDVLGEVPVNGMYRLSWHIDIPGRRDPITVGSVNYRPPAERMARPPSAAQKEP
jgi:hypothetical protein